MRKRLKRFSAQDLFERSIPTFAKRGPFHEVFPEVARLLVEYEETGEVERPDRYEGFAPVLCGKLTHNYISQYIRCTNFRCYGGGFEICQVIGEMVRKKETERQGQADCVGHEGTPKGGKIYGKCFNRFRYKISIAYRD